MVKQGEKQNPVGKCHFRGQESRDTRLAEETCTALKGWKVQCKPEAPAQPWKPETALPDSRAQPSRAWPGEVSRRTKAWGRDTGALIRGLQRA